VISRSFRSCPVFFFRRRLHQRRGCYTSVVTYEALLDEALALPESQRAALVKRLSETLPVPDGRSMDAAWAEEISRRVDDVRSGRVKTIPADVALAEIRAAFNGRHG
jgi:putative addiction module component (TIGR02574 family)